MKILFVHEVSYSKKVIFEMHEFPELLSLKSHEITFLEFDEGRKFWDKNSQSIEAKVTGRVHPNATINLARPFQLGIPGLDRLLAVLTVIPKLRSLLKHGGFDVVVLYAVPTFGPQTLWLAKSQGVPLVFRALDVSHKIRSTLFSPLIGWVEKLIYRKADLLSTHNPAMANYCTNLGRRTKVTKLHLPPLDLSHFQAASRDDKLRSSLGFHTSDKVLVYMGSFFYFSGLKPALSEFARATVADSNLKFLMIGGGEQDAELRALAIELGIQDKVVFTGFISYEDLPKYLRVADIAVNTLEPTLVAHVALPNKVLQYLATGIPIVSTPLDGLRQTFGNVSGISWGDTPEQVVRVAIRLLASDKPVLKEVLKKQVASVSKMFEPGILVEEFEKDLLRLSAGGIK